MTHKYDARLYSGRLVLNLENEEYKELKLLTRIERIWTGIFVVMCLVPIIVLMINYPRNLVLSMYSVLIPMIMCIPMFISINKRKRYLYELVLAELIKQGYTIKYSNNTTGRITYSKNGVGRSIYVFKGKNAKGAR